MGAIFSKGRWVKHRLTYQESLSEQSMSAHHWYTDKHANSFL